jgi:hypothetical protein
LQIDLIVIVHIDSADFPEIQQGIAINIRGHGGVQDPEEQFGGAIGFPFPD